jgi:hypothetical protein
MEKISWKRSYEKLEKVKKKVECLMIKNGGRYLRRTSALVESIPCYGAVFFYIFWCDEYIDLPCSFCCRIETSTYPFIPIANHRLPTPVVENFETKEEESSSKYSNRFAICHLQSWSVTKVLVERD